MNRIPRAITCDRILAILATDEKCWTLDRYIQSGSPGSSHKLREIICRFRPIYEDSYCLERVIKMENNILVSNYVLMSLNHFTAHTRLVIACLHAMKRYFGLDWKQVFCRLLLYAELAKKLLRYNLRIHEIPNYTSECSNRLIWPAWKNAHDICRSVHSGSVSDSDGARNWYFIDSANFIW